MEEYAYLYSRLGSKPDLASLKNTPTATYLANKPKTLVNLYKQFQTTPPSLRVHHYDTEVNLDYLYTLYEDGCFKSVNGIDPSQYRTLEYTKLPKPPGTPYEQSDREIVICFDPKLGNGVVPEWVFHAYRVLCVMDVCFLRIPEEFLGTGKSSPSVTMPPNPLQKISHRVDLEITYSPFGVIGRMDDGIWISAPRLPVYVDRAGTIVETHHGISLGMTYPSFNDLCRELSSEEMDSAKSHGQKAFGIATNANPKTIFACGNNGVVMGYAFVEEGGVDYYVGHDPSNYWKSMLEQTIVEHTIVEHNRGGEKCSVM